MARDDEDVTVEVEELADEEEEDGGELVAGAEPAEVEYFVKDHAALDEDQGQNCLLGLCSA